jgi:pyroglutamyl-peptidase
VIKILVTGFEAFNGDETNPSQIVVSQLENMGVANAKILGEILPVEADIAIAKIKKKLIDFKPDVVILLGVAKGRAAITPERVAINIKDYPIPDNGGNQPVDQVISINGGSAYFSTLPIKSITANLNNAEILAAISNTAGTYVCNHLFYSVSEHLKATNVRYGFIHIPFHCPDKAKPSIAFMPIEQQIEGIKIAIQTCMDSNEEQKLALGSIS